MFETSYIVDTFHGYDIWKIVDTVGGAELYGFYIDGSLKSYDSLSKCHSAIGYFIYQTMKLNTKVYKIPSKIKY